MKYDARQTLADFLSREIGEGESTRAWAKKNGLHPQDVRRALNRETGMSLDKLAAFSSQLGVEAWQLLFPGFERGAPQFPTMSVEAIDLAKQLDKITDEPKRRRAFAAIVQVLEMVTNGTAETTPRVEPTQPDPRPIRSPVQSGRV